MLLTLIITLHLGAALGALLTGPVALWARQGTTQHPQLHRAFGYAWLTLMLITASTALFIRHFSGPNFDGFTPIHLLVPCVFACLIAGFRYLARKNIAAHRKTRQRTYLLLPPRVENAIQHGLDPQVAGGHITVQARCEGTQLTLEVTDTDTDVGFAGPDACHAGFGLSQVRARLSDTYGDQGALELIAGCASGKWARVTFPC